MKQNDMILDYEGSWALLYSQITFLALKRPKIESLNLNSTLMISIGKERYYRVYIHDKDFYRNQEEAIRFFANSLRVNQCKKEIENIINRMKKFVCNKDTNNLISDFDEYCNIVEEYLQYYNFISCTGLYDRVLEKIESIIPEKYEFAKDEIKNSLLASNSENLLTYKELQDWISLCKKKIDNNISEEEISIHSNQFISLHDTTDKKGCFTKEIIEERLNNITVEQLNSLQTKYKGIQKTSERSNLWSLRTFERICQDSQQYDFIRNVSEFPILRLLMRESYQRLKLYATRTFLGDLIKCINKEYNQNVFDYLLIEEIREYIINGTLPSVNEINSRRQNAVFIYDGDVKFTTNEKDIVNINFPTIEKSDVIKGISLFNKGKKVLKVKKIYQTENGMNDFMSLVDNKDIAQLVIVTNTIRPYMIQNCMNIGALILTEGSMTSHASVLCRELGIPCLISATGAMDSLEDGQDVEIDFESGSVFKIDLLKTEEESITKKYIYKYHEAESGDIHFVGGKAANLNKISDLVPIPKGFVISCQASKILESEVTEEYEDLIKEIKENILQLNAKTLAIRSSHEEEDGKQSSFAGVFESYINVPSCNHDLIFQCIRDVIASARRISTKNGCNMAVLIQEMIQADITGVILTSKPRAGYDYMLVEYIYGDLEGIMSGKVQPFRTYVPKSDLLENQQLVDICIPALLEEENQEAFNEIARMALSIERCFSSPVEIEWGIVKGKPCIFQARTY